MNFNKPPKRTVLSLKSELDRLIYSKENIEALKNIFNEWLCHYMPLSNLYKDDKRLNKTFFPLYISQDRLENHISTSDNSEKWFDTSRHQLMMLILDLQKIIEDENIDDISLSDINPLPLDF